MSKREIVKEISEIAEDLVEQILQHIRLVTVPALGFLVRAIIVIIPFLIGALLENPFQEYFQNGKLLNFDIWINTLKQTPLVLLVILLLFAYLFHGTLQYRYRHADRVYTGLKWFYEELGFEANSDQEIRCTVWVPWSRRNGKPFKLMQLVDYVPRMTQLPSGSKFREHKHAGRVFKVSRRNSDVQEAIGSLGKCALWSSGTETPRIVLESIPENVDTFQYLVGEANFKPRHAKRLTPNRRSVICLPIMNESLSVLLGVIYCDARTPDAFPREIANKAESYIPRFAKLLSEKH